MNSGTRLLFFVGVLTLIAVVYSYLDLKSSVATVIENSTEVVVDDAPGGAKRLWPRGRS